MIHDVKNYPIIQVSSQELSTSSKYGLQGRGVLEPLLFMLESWKLLHISQITYLHDPWCQEWPHPPSIQSGTINDLKMRTSRTGGSWHTSIHAREQKFCTQVKNHLSWQCMMSSMTPSSKYPVKNHKSHPSMDFKDRVFLTLLYSD